MTISNIDFDAIMNELEDAQTHSTLPKDTLSTPTFTTYRNEIDQSIESSTVNPDLYDEVYAQDLVESIRLSTLSNTY